MVELILFLKKLVHSDELELKLPNDVLVNGKKVSGVLIEVSYPYAVIGIGINLVVSPIAIATNLNDEFGILVKPMDLIDNLYAALSTRILN
jgi:BirA family biotin operon repressor/biotin-[acetyl-CoA-carboxylase] ligase